MTEEVCARPPDRKMRRAAKRVHGLLDLRAVALLPIRRRCFWTWPWGHRWGPVQYWQGERRQLCVACGCDRDDLWDGVS